MQQIKYPKPVDLTKFLPAQDNLEAKYGLPKNIFYCKKCVISNQRPNSAVEYDHKQGTKKATIRFDDDQICDACRFSEKKNGVIDWSDREKRLRELCDKHRKGDGSYDCIVPGSGGRIVFMLLTYSKINTECILSQLLGHPIFIRIGGGRIFNHG